MHGGVLPLQGLKGHPDGVKATLQLAYFMGGVRVALAGLVCPANNLAELTPIIRGGNNKLNPLWVGSWHERPWWPLRT